VQLWISAIRYGILSLLDKSFGQVNLVSKVSKEKSANIFLAVVSDSTYISKMVNIPVNAIRSAIPITCASSLGLLLVGLGVNVIAKRMKTQSSALSVDDSNIELQRAVRMHGNTAEHTGVITVLMLYFHTTPRKSIFLDVSMVAFTLSRFMIVYGISQHKEKSKPHPTRLFGAVGTYLFGAMITGGALFHGLKDAFKF